MEDDLLDYLLGKVGSEVFVRYYRELSDRSIPHVELIQRLSIDSASAGNRLSDAAYTLKS